MESVNASRKTLMIKGNTSLCIAILFLIILWGCAKKEMLKNIPDEAELRERVTMYWDYKVKEEFDKMYEYEYSLYRKQVSLTKYIKSFNTTRAKWMDASVKEIKIEDSNADVAMKVRVLIYNSPRNIEQDVVVNEKWSKVEGKWYHIPQKLKGPTSSN